MKRMEENLEMKNSVNGENGVKRRRVCCNLQKEQNESIVFQRGIDWRPFWKMRVSELASDRWCGKKFIRMCAWEKCEK